MHSLLWLKSEQKWSYWQWNCFGLDTNMAKIPKKNIPYIILKSNNVFSILMAMMYLKIGE